MKICEIFGNTIAGEGPFMGYPMTFIRTSGCNLKCRINTTGFNCDTQYHINGKKLTVEEIINEVKKYPSKYICITGGNPTIQKQINMLIEELINNSYTVHIEDNGSLPFPKMYKSCIVICSPKYNIKLKRWKFYNKNKPNYFKFVYTSSNHEAILKFIKNYNISRSQIFIMPEGCSRDEVIENCERTILFCNQHNLIFSPREHIMIWDKKRGV